MWRSLVALVFIAALLSSSVPGKCFGQVSAADFFARGSELLREGDHDKAITAVSVAIALEPSNNEYRLMRAALYAAKGDKDQAIADCDKAILQDPNFREAFVVRGETLLSKGDYDLAIADFDEAIRLGDKDAGIYAERGLAWGGKSNYDRAIADFDEAIRLKSDYALAYYWRGRAHADKGDYDRAIADFDEAIRLDFDSVVDCYFWRALARTENGDYRRAISDFDEVLRRDREIALALNGLAWLLATCARSECRDGAKAVTLARRACELTEWKEWTYVDTLAAAYAENGDFQTAAKWQTEALRLVVDGNPSERKDAEDRLALYRTAQPYRDLLTDPLALQLGRARLVPPAPSIPLRGPPPGIARSVE